MIKLELTGICLPKLATLLVVIRTTESNRNKLIQSQKTLHSISKIYYVKTNQKSHNK